MAVFLGRQPDADLASGFAWVPGWLRTNWDMKDQFARPLGLGSLLTLLLLALAWKKANIRQKLSHLLLIILPVAFALVMWFFTAPNPRYLRVDHLAPAARRIACLDLRHLTLSQRFRRARFLRQLLCSRHVAL